MRQNSLLNDYDNEDETNLLFDDDDEVVIDEASKNNSHLHLLTDHMEEDENIELDRGPWSEVDEALSRPQTTE